MAEKQKASAEDRTKMYDILEGIQTGNKPRDEIIQGQKDLKSKLGPEAYKQLRLEVGNALAKTSNHKGKAISKKDIPVIAISVGKARMSKGGMANGKLHMYTGGGAVKDNLGPGLTALNKVRPDVVKKMLKK